MRIIRYGVVAAAAGLAVATAACEPTAPESVDSVVVISGDSQVVSVNGFTDPIEVQALQANGKPRGYAPLYWTIGRREGNTIVPAGRVVQAYASADRNGRATGEFQVAEAGVYEVEALAKVYTNEQGQQVKVSAVAIVTVQAASTAEE